MAFEVGSERAPSSPSLPSLPLSFSLSLSLPCEHRQEGPHREPNWRAPQPQVSGLQSHEEQRSAFKAAGLWGLLWPLAGTNSPLALASRPPGTGADRGAVEGPSPRLPPPGAPVEVDPAR